MQINEMAMRAHANAKDKGWHDSTASVWKWLGNIHSEVSEAWEEARNGVTSDLIRVTPEGKPEGFSVELADILIRVGDMAVALGIDLEKAIETKMAYNSTRPYRHGGKLA